MSREHRLLWTIVGLGALTLAPPGSAQEVPPGLDSALRGQVARPRPKRELPRTVLRPVFWSPSPTVRDLVVELRKTETAELPSADTLYEPDPHPLTSRSKNPSLSPERTIVYVALADPVPGMSLERRCEAIRAEIEAERRRLEKGGTLPGEEAVAAAACRNVWARHEGARLDRMLDPRGDVYRWRLGQMLAEKDPDEADRAVEERLREQIREQHLEQLLGGSAIDAEMHRYQLPRRLATRRPDETDEDIERGLSEETWDETARPDGRGTPRGVGGKEIAIERAAAEFWPHRAASDRTARFQKLCGDMLDERRLWLGAKPRLVHYVLALDPRLSYEEASDVVEKGTDRGRTPLYLRAQELVRRERQADLLMRLSEMNAWETAGRGTPEAYRAVEAMMNEALDAALRTNPRAQERRHYYQTEVRFPEDRAGEAVRAELRTEFLLRLCDCARDARNPNEKALDKVLSRNPHAAARLESLRKEFPLERAKEMVKAEFRSEFLWRVSKFEEDQTSLDEINLPEAPLYPEFRVKQFVREYRLAPVTAAADRLHAALCPPTGHPTPEQARDAAREAFANHSPDEVNQLRTLYRERWLRGSNGGEPQDLDGAIYAALGGDLAIHDQCEAILNPAQAASLARLHAITDTLHGSLSPPTGQPTAEQVRDAVREACANRSPEEVNELRLDYRRRWSTDLDAEVAAKLGTDRRLRRECQALLHSRRGSKPDDGPN